MTTTSSWFQNKDHARAGLVLVIEGTDLIYTTIVDRTAIKTAWAGTDWAAVTWRGGLKISGSMSQGVELFNPEIKPDSLVFSIADEVGSDTNLAQTLIRMASNAATWTFLESDIDANDTVMTVTDTTNFGTSGTVYIGNETIDYTGKTATTFTGLTRGKFNLWETNGGGRWSTAHKINTINNSKPIVSDTPTDSYNRGVALYLHHYENGAWSTKANAKLLWAGRIKSIRDTDNAFHITAQNFTEVLARSTMLSEPFHGETSLGKWINEPIWRVRVVEEVAGTTINDVEADLYSTAARYEWSHVLSKLTELLSATGSLGASLTYDWSVFPGYGLDGRLRVHCQTSGIGANIATRFMLYLSAEVWGLLGFTSIGGMPYQNSGSIMIGLALGRSGDDFTRDAEDMPILSYPGIGEGATLDLDTSSGTFLKQTNFPDIGLPPAVDGFLKIGDMKVVAVKQMSATQYTIRRDVSTDLATLGMRLTVPNSEDTIAVIRVGEGSGRVQAKQVWWETDTTADLLLRTLLSTGTTAFNHATHDASDEGMGLAIPASAIDVDSFDGLGDDPITLFLESPKPFAPYLTSILATSGQYLVWKDGKLTIRRPRFDGSSLAAAWTLTESNKGGEHNASDGRPQIDYSSDGLVNRFQLEYGATVSGQFGRIADVQDVVSITNYGQRRTIKQQGLALGKANLQPWIDNVAAVGLALFSRPITRVTRTYDQTLLEMVPLDTVSLSDNYMIDPVVGTRGVGSFPGWLLSTEYNFDKQRGEARIAMLTDIDPSRIGAWAPSARVDDGAANSGYNAGTSTLTLKANEYSHTSQGTDVDFFAAGDVVHIVELSPANPASPTEWTRTIDTIGTNTITLAAGLSSPAWDSTLLYVVEHTAISGAVVAQKAEAFIADDADNSTGDADNDAYMYGGLPDTVSDFTRVATQRFRRIPDTADDTGNPFSIYKYHDGVRSLSNLMVYKTRAVCPSDALVVHETVTETSFTLAYGPIWTPIYNGSGRNLLVQIRGYVGAGTGTFRVYASPHRVTGASDTTTVYPLDAQSVDFTTTSTTAVWMTEATLVVWPFEFANPPGVWITVELKNSVAKETTMTSLVISEGSS